jgi:hypothetical protein
MAASDEDKHESLEELAKREEFESKRKEHYKISGTDSSPGRASSSSFL